MESNIKVKQAIQKKFPEIESSANVKTAIDLMAKADVSVLAVKASGEFIGILSVSDVMHSLVSDDDLDETQISNFMTECSIDDKDSSGKLCVQLDEDQDVISALKVMYEGGINHLLVSGQNNEAVGIVSNLDLIKLIASK